MARHRKKPPAWLVGLIIAVFVFAAALVVFAMLGYGDDPVVENLGGLIR